MKLANVRNTVNRNPNIQSPQNKEKEENLHVQTTKETLAITIWQVCNIESNKKKCVTSSGNKPKSNKKLSFYEGKKKDTPNLIAFQMELQDGCFKGEEQM